MASYHELEELIYGPESMLDRNTKVFLCIRHATFRDDLSRKFLLKDFIMKKTGLDKSEIERAVKILEKNEMILVHRSKTGKVWNPNEYQLHPKRFGNHLNWYKNNPKLTFIKGGKGYPQEGQSYPQIRTPHIEVPANERVGDPANERVGVPADERDEKVLKFSELMEKIASKNPCINNPNTKTQDSGGDFQSPQGNQGTEKKQRTPEEHKRIIQEQLAQMRAGAL